MDLRYPSCSVSKVSKHLHLQGRCSHQVPRTSKSWTGIQCNTAGEYKRHCTTRYTSQTSTVMGEKPATPCLRLLVVWSVSIVWLGVVIYTTDEDQVIWLKHWKKPFSTLQEPPKGLIVTNPGWSNMVLYRTVLLLTHVRVMLHLVNGT